jgi:hypothetical protein
MHHHSGHFGTLCRRCYGVRYRQTLQQLNGTRLRHSGYRNRNELVTLISTVMIATVTIRTSNRPGGDSARCLGRGGIDPDRSRATVIVSNRMTRTRHRPGGDGAGRSGSEDDGPSGGKVHHLLMNPRLDHLGIAPTSGPIDTQRKRWRTLVRTLVSQ